MKTLTLFSVLLLAACGSSSDFGLQEDTQHTDCEHGEVEVRIGLSGPGTDMERGMDNRLTLTVEVANNSRDDITVKAVRVEQTERDMASFVVQDAYRHFNETIHEDEDHVFELPTNGRSVFDRSNRRTMGPNELYFVVSVYLEDGTYRCKFGVPVRSR